MFRRTHLKQMDEHIKICMTMHDLEIRRLHAELLNRTPFVKDDVQVSIVKNDIICGMELKPFHVVIDFSAHELNGSSIGWIVNQVAKQTEYNLIRLRNNIEAKEV